jgi:alkanesulfonate monooxygenase SsuD/methylene tetrahydromethanopterin reductase-like flavin-dependent oxidoreductase (luciferase family)
MGPPASAQTAAPSARRADYGLVVTAIDTDPTAWHRLGGFFADLEAAGCRSIWLTDHLFSGHPSAEPFVLAGVAAASTTRCRIGTGVLQLPLRRSAVVAKSATTLQLVSGGRFVLGVGVGHHPREFERVGVDFHRRGAAADRLLHELVGHWQASDGWFALRPTATVPIWFGGTSDAALRRIVAFGAGWLSLFQSPRRFGETNSRLTDMLESAGRESGAVERRIVLFVSPTDDGWSRNDALRWVARQFPGGSAGVDRHVITGSVDDCAAGIRAFERAGATGVDLQITHPEPLASFQSLQRALATSG